ncbi:MAG: hypothetical protein Tsb0010_15710 [Parvularculaceae bacterium]
MIVACLAAAAGLAACAERASAPEPAGRVDISASAPDIFTIEETVSIMTGDTVFDAMLRLRAAGAIAFTASGAGETAFILSIGGVANEGAGGRNWTYDLNGACAVLGAGAQAVADGDRIAWRFAGAQDSCG